MNYLDAIESWQQDNNREKFYEIITRYEKESLEKYLETVKKRIIWKYNSRPGFSDCRFAVIAFGVLLCKTPRLGYTADKSWNFALRANSRAYRRHIQAWRFARSAKLQKQNRNAVVRPNPLHGSTSGQAGVKNPSGRNLP
jgi:hypothetical protein